MMQKKWWCTFCIFFHHLSFMDRKKSHPMDEHNLCETTEEKHDMSLYLWCHPIIWKTRRFNLTWNSDIIGFFADKSTAAAEPEPHTQYQWNCDTESTPHLFSYFLCTVALERTLHKLPIHSNFQEYVNIGSCVPMLISGWSWARHVHTPG